MFIDLKSRERETDRWTDRQRQKEREGKRSGDLDGEGVESGFKKRHNQVQY